MSQRSVGSIVLAFVLVACSGKEFTGLQPKLQVKTPAPEANGHYLIDFGRTTVGVSVQRAITVTNIGRAPMVVQPVEVTSPITANQKTTSQVAVQAVLQIGFIFTPGEPGPISQTTELKTAGGNVTIDFVGEGVAGRLPDCEYAVEPAALDFGSILPGTTKTSGVRFVNKGAYDCDLSAIQIDPASDTVFSVAEGQPLTAAIPAGAGAYPVGVTFAPPVAGTFSGKVTFIVGPQGTTVEVPLTAGSSEAPCEFSVVPTAINFGNVTAGQTKTSGVTVTRTGDADCSIASLQLAAGSDASFTLASGQATSATLNATTNTFNINATFAPTAAGNSFTGKLTFVVGPQNMTVEVPMSGSSTTATCGYRVTPTSLAFGSVVAGHPKTLTATVSRTGSTACSISGLQLDPSSNPAYSLASGQATSGSLPNALSTFNIKVTFNPTAVGASFTGKATFLIGPPGTTVNVPLSGSSPALCANPNPDGTCPAATGSVYLNTSSDLYRFDPTTHQSSRIGAFHGADGLFNMYDIAIDPAGQLLGVSSGTLYVIDPLTALCTKVGSVDNSANGLTFLPDGRLVAAGSNVEIIDPHTYAVSSVLVPSGTYTSSGDIIALPDGKLYWTVTGSSSDVLIRVDPLNGTMGRIGATTGYSAIYGLGYDNGTLFGFNNGKYLIISQTNAATTSGGLSGDWYGATTNPSVW